MTTNRHYVLSLSELATLQREQFAHDQRNHSDIAFLAKTDRLKHYGLHFAKYVGRLARGTLESKPVERTIVDTALISLCAANTLHQRLDMLNLAAKRVRNNDPFLVFADAVGRFGDACEKIDHMEDFLDMAIDANHDIVVWVLDVAAERRIDLGSAIRERRHELSQRYFNFG